MGFPDIGSHNVKLLNVEFTNIGSPAVEFSNTGLSAVGYTNIGSPVVGFTIARPSAFDN